ncbi:alpha/beta hydrolase fold protein [Rhodomicrobium vannielii ATCC 17100]|uniref:Alpha/beta hydrolase fold protein n=1 Tax=Rhodomicrobium vannielii (strain ATCC 17100 / DSM 162 / LMG 4299 / NCIMB 10020 / ATH 3.1.1) TaxID=648757 RepID=E3I5S4_RHOVT|nr:alpha/beta fold hydrolase [Rhodomicrobium vannielii]ADP69427.1 alpha/beta hydrolase fold protein [Rhodomicrobium vannielii ATCC 17100]
MDNFTSDAPDAGQSALFERAAAEYLNKAASVDPALLRDWRQPDGLYRRVRRAIGLLPGIRARTATVDGHELRYWDAGPANKPAAVLLHGFSASKENWLNVVLFLARSHRLLVPDIPGFGESSFVPDASYGLAAQADRLKAWFAQTGAEKAHWVGSSMGGALAGLVAAKSPDLVRSLILMDSAGVAGEGLSPFEAGLLDGRNGLIAEKPEDMEAIFTLLSGKNGGGFQNAILAALVARDQIARAPVYRHLFREMILSPELPATHWAPNIAAPTLVVWGEADKILDPAEASVLASLIRGCEILMMKEVGHLPMLEAPARTAALLKLFWSRFESSDAAA